MLYPLRDILGGCLLSGTVVAPPEISKLSMERPMRMLVATMFKKVPVEKPSRERRSANAVARRFIPSLFSKPHLEAHAEKAH